MIKGQLWTEGYFEKVERLRIANWVGATNTALLAPFQFLLSCPIATLMTISPSHLDVAIFFCQSFFLTWTVQMISVLGLWKKIRLPGHHNAAIAKGWCDFCLVMVVTRGPGSLLGPSNSDLLSYVLHPVFSTSAKLFQASKEAFRWWDELNDGDLMAVGTINFWSCNDTQFNIPKSCWILKL